MIIFLACLGYLCLIACGLLVLAACAYLSLLAIWLIREVWADIKS